VAELVIYGAGDLARHAFASAEDDLGHKVLAFVVDDGQLDGTTDLEGRPILPWSSAREQGLAKAPLFVAVGYRSMKARAELFQRLQLGGATFLNLISPRAAVSRRARLGVGNFIMEGAVIERDAALGDNNIVWSSTTICHDACVQSHTFIAAGCILGGHVTVGDRAFLGFGSIVRERRSIGNDSLVGAGSVVLRDVPAHTFQRGNPATQAGVIDRSKGVTVE
jgi:UDP-N-acetylbacillosamine N-acetyltransferase